MPLSWMVMPSASCCVAADGSILQAPEPGEAIHHGFEFGFERRHNLKRAVETALLYLLISAIHSSTSGEGRILRWEWYIACDETMAAAVRVAGHRWRTAPEETEGIAPEGLKDKAARRLPKDRSVAIEGVFRPNERIRSLPAVFQAPDQVVLLKCSECAESMNSTWFWKHPWNGGMMVTQPAGTRWERDVLGPWLSLDGTNTVLDNFNQFDFCAHKRRRSWCIECGGHGLCPHYRQRSRCSECKPFSPRRKMHRNCSKTSRLYSQKWMKEQKKPGNLHFPLGFLNKMTFNDPGLPARVQDPRGDGSPLLNAVEKEHFKGVDDQMSIDLLENGWCIIRWLPFQNQT